MISVNRFRDIVEPPHPLFEEDQSLGPLLPFLFQQIADKGITLVLSTKGGLPRSLVTRSDWDGFLSQYLRSGQPLMTDRAVAESLQDSLGVAFANFVRLVDDLANSPDRNLTVDVTKGTAGANLLQLYDTDDSYIWNANEGAEAPVAAGATVHFRASAPSRIGSQILTIPPDIRGRDRQEVEAHANFQYSESAEGVFRVVSGNEPWRLLDLRQLPGNFWEEAQRMQLVQQFHMPLHLEVSAGDAGYQDTTSDFLEAYLDTEDALLFRSSLSLRARKRPDQADRALIQMKQERPRQGGRPVREKWERRFTLNAPELDSLIEMAASGLDHGNYMPELRKLYEKLANLGMLPQDGLLRLRPEHFIVQRRRRSHLQLDTLQTVSSRAAFLRQVRSGQNPPAETLTKFLQHVENQLRIMEDAQRIFSERGMNMPSGEAVIISHDRWSVFEPGAYAINRWPVRLDDPGLRGKGLRVEAELDAWTSEPISDALALIDEDLLRDPTNAKLRHDRQVMAEFQDALFEDVSRTVDMKREIMVNAGLIFLTDVPVDKSDTAREMIRKGQEGFRQGHRFWL